MTREGLVVIEGGGLMTRVDVIRFTYCLLILIISALLVAYGLRSYLLRFLMTSTFKCFFYCFAMMYSHQWPCSEPFSSMSCTYPRSLNMIHDLRA